MSDLKQICEEAMAVGRTIDMTGVVYGYRKKFDRIVGARDYYRLLAGLVRTQKLLKIFEVGTFWGGSIMAMSRGVDIRHTGTLVTVDIKAYNREGLAEYPNIRRLIGNSLNSLVANKVREIFGAGTPGIDLLFIDSYHDYDNVMANVNLYGPMLNPRFIVLDDIHLNPSMEDAWKELTERYNTTFDASVLADRACGFGVIELWSPK